MGVDLLDKIQDLLNVVEGVSIGGARPDLVEAAERRLGVQLPASFRCYLERWGNISIGSIEYYGLTAHRDFDNAAVPNFVWFTLRSRMNVNLPNDLVVFLNKDGDEYICLDAGKLHDGECPVVIWDNVERTVTQVLRCDFAQYLLGDLEEMA